jgi:hypothetical protein
MNTRTDETIKTLKLKIISLMVLVGFFVMVFYYYIQSAYLGRSYPLSSPFCYPPHFMTDFTNDLVRIATYDPFHTLIQGFGNNYPPFAYLSTVPFSFWGETGGILLTVATILGGFWVFLWREYRLRVDPFGLNWFFLIVLGCLTYPMLFEIDRLNAEGLIFLWLVGFWIFYQRKQLGPAVFCLGAATASKVYPGMFILILLAERRFRHVGYWLGTVVGLSALSLLVFKTSPEEMLRVYAQSAPKIHELMLTPNFVFQHSSNLLGMVRAIQAIVWPTSVTDLNFAQVTHSYYHFLVLVPALAFFVAILRNRLVIWEKLTLVAIAIILLPTVSFDYKLIHLFIPLAAFLNSQTDKRTTVFFSVLFGLVLMPKGYSPTYFDTNSQVIINPLVLTAMALPLIWKAVRKAAPSTQLL